MNYIVWVKQFIVWFWTVIWLVSDNILYGQIVNKNCLITDYPFLFHCVDMLMICPIIISWGNLEWHCGIVIHFLQDFLSFQGEVMKSVFRKIKLLGEAFDIISCNSPQGKVVKKDQFFQLLKLVLPSKSNGYFDILLCVLDPENQGYISKIFILVLFFINWCHIVHLIKILFGVHTVYRVQ